MIDALIAGKINGTPQQKTGKNGHTYVTAKVRAQANDEQVFVNVIAFANTAQSALLALGDGETVALSGSLKPTAWTDKDGNARPSLDMVASAALTPYHVTRKRKAVAGTDTPTKTERPSHDAWKARASGNGYTPGFDDDDALNAL